MYSLRGEFGASEMEELQKTGSTEAPQVRDVPAYLKVDYAFINDPKVLRLKTEKFRKITKSRSQKAP